MSMISKVERETGEEKEEEVKQGNKEKHTRRGRVPVVGKVKVRCVKVLCVCVLVVVVCVGWMLFGMEEGGTRASSGTCEE